MTASMDPREAHHRIPSPEPGLSLFLRHLAPEHGGGDRPVLYVHGATFPSSLSIAHRFDGIIAEIGRRAVERILLGETAVKREILPVTLVERASTGTPARS